MPLLGSPAVLANLLSLWQPARSPKRGRPSLEVPPNPIPSLHRAAAQVPIQRIITPQASLPAHPAPEKYLKVLKTAGPRRTCACGVCIRCLDDAKWERIFNEKFNDPSYYHTLFVRHNSSLGT
jgi:hypothetical protein